MTLTDLVPSLEVCRQLRAAGFPQDTAMAYYRQHCDVYEGEAPQGMSLEDWEVVQGRPVVCVRAQMENHIAICAALAAEEILRELPPYLQGSCVQLDLNVSHVVCCNFDGVQQEPLWIVQWCCAEIDETVGRQESPSSLVQAAAAA